MRYAVGVVLCCFAFFPALGCRTARIEEGGGISAFSPQATEGAAGAVYVESDLDSSSRATHYFWGVTHVNRPERTFRELLRRSAADTAGLDVTDVSSASGPGGGHLSASRVQKLAQEAAKQDADFLFTAGIESWRQNYVLFFQWARITFSLACYSLPEGELVWAAKPTVRRVYGTDREALFMALNKLFTAALDAADEGR